MGVLARLYITRCRPRAGLACRFYSPMGRITPEDAGITEFLSPGLEGFTACLKTAPADFQVYELTPSGQELHLTELWGPTDAALLPLPSAELSPDVFDAEVLAPEEHLHFRLYKEGIDTMEAIACIARCVGRSRRAFRFAGTKDRCAVTVQRVSCARLSSDALRRAVLHRNWHPRIRFSDLEVMPHEIELGDLSGNRFDIVLRGVPQETCDTPSGRAVLDRCFSDFRANGYLNYFGQQRFGSQQIHSFHVGAAILSGRFTDAVRLILGDSSPLEHSSHAAPHTFGLSTVREATSDLEAAALESQICFAETGDAGAALQLMPRSQAVERGLLGALAEGLSAKEALGRLPRQLLMLYGKSAQSLIFNHVLSRRLHRFGLAPVVGDLVFTDGAAGTKGRADAGIPRRGPLVLPPVSILTGPSETNTMQLQKVVLPLPGSAVTYPPNLHADYEELSQKLLGIPLDVFHNVAPLGLSLTGTYRSAVVYPQGVEWRVVSATEAAMTAREQRGRLLLTDVDRLHGMTVCSESISRSGSSARGVVGEDCQGKGIEHQGLSSTGSVVFSCKLPPSAYLTMAFRQLTRKEV